MLTNNVRLEPMLKRDLGGIEDWITETHIDLQLTANLKYQADSLPLISARAKNKWTSRVNFVTFRWEKHDHPNPNKPDNLTQSEYIYKSTPGRHNWEYSSDPDQKAQPV